MARVMRAIRSKLVSANLMPLFDADPDCFFKDARSGSYHIMGASLIDDSLFNSVHIVPAVCVTNAASIATIVFDEFALHSLDNNLEIGKTEFLLDLLVQVISSIMSLPVPHRQVVSRFMYSPGYSFIVGGKRKNCPCSLL